jgi:DNA-binding transcriptional ArsR family regulator
MKKQTRRRYEARARVLKALAHPTRLWIVEMLSKREKCVCELTDKIGADISTVSKHLSVLKNAGIVQDRKKGLQVYYRLKCPCAERFFSCVESVLKSNAKEQIKILKECKR